MFDLKYLRKYRLEISFDGTKWHRSAIGWLTVMFPPPRDWPDLMERLVYGEILQGVSADRSNKQYARFVENTEVEMGVYQIELDEEDLKDGASIQLVLPDGTWMTQALNVFIHDKGKFSVDIVCRNDQQLRALSWSEGKRVFNESTPGNIICVEGSPLPKGAIRNERTAEATG